MGISTFQAVNARQFEKLKSLPAPDLVQHFSDRGATVYGSSAVISRFRSVIKRTPDLHLSLARVIAQGANFAAMIDVSYTLDAKRESVVPGDRLLTGNH